MSDRETAFRVYLALVSRDPLPQQRFTEIGDRFMLLAHLASAAAKQFEDVRDLWEKDPAVAAAEAAKFWDMRAAPRETPNKVRNLIGADQETHLPKSQGDLLGEMRS